MWRLHWRRAIFYSAITKRQHVLQPTYMCAHARTHTQTHTHSHAYALVCIIASLYAYLLTGALFADNEGIPRRGRSLGPAAGLF